MSLDTLAKYPVTNTSKTVYHNNDRAINFYGALAVGNYSDPINGNNGSLCIVQS
jgi:hypothetical protein